MITIESLIRTASGVASGVIAVAAAHDEEVLKAVRGKTKEYRKCHTGGKCNTDKEHTQ